MAGTKLGVVTGSVAGPEDATSLGDAARTALADAAGVEGQQAFDGMDNVTKVRFTGMAFDSIDEGINLGDELTFLVRARCTAETKETLKDGLTRNIRRMDVQSVIIRDES